ncbi:hypothetical protein MLD38_024977 [Melastoma candidum]|uniref:Uncharacterized protein n=1 Tax=Melastoma candidum TaxID=119954 RepID=A0ACB9NTN8_9MYRT|nr:hypothetical protein MLD38_024977 [Melastoma candidum]
MAAFLGFVVQHNATGKGPFENLLQHLSDPWHTTIVQTLEGLILPGVPSHPLIRESTRETGEVEDFNF